MSIGNLKSKYKLNPSTINYIISLADKHGVKIFKKNNNNKYSLAEKEKIINRIMNQ